MGELIGLSRVSKNGLQKAGQAPITERTGSGEKYLYLGEIRTESNSYATEILLIVGLHLPTWADNPPIVQLLKASTDNPGNPNVTAFNLFGTTTDNIYREGNKIYLKNKFTYGTSYSVLRLTSIGLINLAMTSNTAPSGTDLETIL
ncbi:hypothetical protein [uncultured Phocaeicola sp.]|uniref:hypothetical protein n=1 Tax=uncultured Phocaeicola sp. TaxID=990718 RepID=UPI0025FC2F51|nr:hypothetical protein [uncultured Phocaeicola sp.]